MEFSDDFAIAVQDYYDLLEKKYPQKSIHKLVGDRYKLSGTERSMLYRGVSTKEENKLRSEKLIPEELVKDQDLYVDGFNQILTIASYLNGNVVFISSDGFLRDASEIHGKIFRSELLSRSIELILIYCDSLNIDQLVFYIDQQVNNHEKLKNNLSSPSSGHNSDIEIILSDKVDKRLKEVSTGIIATSDSQIIEKTDLKIFDLACQTLKFHFHPKFFDINSLLLS
ncbi:MAG: DUF434 domain-containing protein [Bacteroidales bacterium]|nr:DUF434 domain-containing protein [Bacteroidales bacterium]